MYSIECKNLTKRYNGFTAVDGVDFTVDKGIICGLLGPNGAGKSTVIRILSCQSLPDAGLALVSNLDVVKDKREVLSSIGVVPQEHSFYSELTVIENLLYFGSLYHMPIIELKRRSNEILRLLELYEKRDSRSGTLSGGMKTRLNIACALVHEPKVVILDEPSVGLDPVSRRALWRTIRELKEEDVTFLLTTHYMEEAEELCDMIYIMNRGKIVARGSPMELKKSIGEDVVTIKSRPGRIDVIKPNLEKLAGVSSCKVVRDMFMITMRDKELDTILDVFKRHREKVISIEVTKPSLEDVFIHVTGEEWH
jgi:ABC-2 type transport system ATP-binding protein